MLHSSYIFYILSIFLIFNFLHPIESVCGNGIIEKYEGEECDQNNLGEKNCISFGFDAGWIGCNQQCHYNTTDCIKCGNGQCEFGEGCGSCPQDCGECPSRLLTKNDLVFKGSFNFPSNPGNGSEYQTFAYGGHAMTFIPNCHYGADPSPDDGYPGCIGAIGHVYNNLYGVFDIPVPSMNKNVLSELPYPDVVKQMFDVTEGKKDIENIRELSGILHAQYDDSCYTIWMGCDWYNVEGINLPNIGYSSCDPNQLDSQGPFQMFGDYIHSSKTSGYLSLIPPNVDFLNSDRFISGFMRENGAFQGSQGPVVASFDIEEGAENVTASALLFSRYRGEPSPLLPIPMDFHMYQPQDDFNSAVWVNYHGKEAVIFIGSKSAVGSKYPDDPRGPEVWWYGEATCDEGEEAGWPHWYEMDYDHLYPPDCNLTDTCMIDHGFHSTTRTPWLLFYDPQEFKLVINGTKKPWEIQPYDIWKHPSFAWEDYSCHESFGGFAFDQESGLLYLSQLQGQNWDGLPIIHTLQIDIPEPFIPSSTAPIEPISSTAPIEPSSSTAPIEPSSSTAPIEPSSSTAPIEPSSSTAPIEPISSSTGIAVTCNISPQAAHTTFPSVCFPSCYGTCVEGYTGGPIFAECIAYNFYSYSGVCTSTSGTTGDTTTGSKWRTIYLLPIGLGVIVIVGFLVTFCRYKARERENQMNMRQMQMNTYDYTQQF